MERLSELISKLSEEFAQKADPSQLLQTTQMIEAEILRLSNSARKTLSTTKVAVVMPASVKIATAEANDVQPVKPAAEPPAPSKNGSYTTAKKPEQNNYLFNPLTEIPTLAHQPG